MDAFRAGFIALVGLPNAGKSTLLNRVLRQKVAITSSKPQTTRKRLLGIWHVDGVQAVLVDTPGLHKPKGMLNEAMVKDARAALEGVDLICWVIDATKAVEQVSADKPVVASGIAYIAALLAQAPKVVIALNKIDAVAGRESLLPVMAELSAILPDAAIIPISAGDGSGITQLCRHWQLSLPEGPAMFPEDQFVQATERELAAELVREKVFRLTKDEIPYATAVEIEKFDETERESERPIVKVYARILVEKDSQKAIVIGKGGQMLKRIGTDARRDMQKLLGAQVYLELHVAVRKNWTSSARMLKSLGYE